MSHRFIAICLALLALCGSALAVERPDTGAYALGPWMLQNAIASRTPVTFSLQIKPTTLAFVPVNQQSAASLLLSRLSLDGAFVTGEEGLMLEAALLLDDQILGDMAVAPSDGMDTTRLFDTWFAGMSVIPAMTESWFSAEIPFADAFFKQIDAIWRYATPFASDNNRLSVPSGATGHALTYEINQAGLREILNAWVDDLQDEPPMIPGVTESDFFDFLVKLRDFATRVEMHGTMKVNMTFGAGDFMRTAKGSQTVRYDGRSTALSFSYTGDQSSTRLTKKLNIAFDQAKGDSFIFRGSNVTTATTGGRASSTVSVSASGNYDGQPYRLRYNTEMLNRYSLDSEMVVTEILTGTLTADCKWAGATIWSLAVKRQGHWTSRDYFVPPSGQEILDITIKDAVRTLFNGQVTLAIAANPDTVLPTPDNVTALDETEIAGILALAIADLKEALFLSLPDDLLSAILKAY